MGKDIIEIFNTVTPDDRKVSLGLGKDSQLYVNGQRIVTEQKVSLQWWVNLAIAVGGLSTAVLAIVAVLQFLGYRAGG